MTTCRVVSLAMAECHHIHKCICRIASATSDVRQIFPPEQAYHSRGCTCRLIDLGPHVLNGRQIEARRVKGAQTAVRDEISSVTMPMDKGIYIQ